MNNYYKSFDFKEAERLIRLALKEDIGKGDVTSELLIPANSKSKAQLLVKDNGIIAGLEIFKLVFKIIDKSIRVKYFRKDGEEVKRNELIGEVIGNTGKILQGERIALNILQRMSGIATYTNQLNKKLNNKNIKIIDTRKTTPNFRLFEKLAVKIGGGENHRFGLYDMILIKDNHIEGNGGINNTLRILGKTKKKLKQKVEIEVKNLAELKSVVLNGSKTVDRIMLDNFKVKEIREAIELIKGKFEIELSGGINEGNIQKYSKFNRIDFISVGSLTHSYRSMDISLNFIT